MAKAERMKKSAGCALGRMVLDDEEVEVPGVGGHTPRRVPRRVLSDIIEPRIEEIFLCARHRMEEIGLVDQIGAGVVLTGGAALMEGMPELAEEILGMPVRLGFPIGITKGLTQQVYGPQYSTSVGLVRYGSMMLKEAQDRGATLAASQPDIEPEIGAKRRRKWFWKWIKEAF